MQTSADLTRRWPADLPDDPPVLCQVCTDTGWMDTGNGVTRCTGQKATGCRWLESRRGHAPGVPEDERDSSLDNYTKTDGNAEAIKHAGYFIEGVHRGLYLFGGVGTGKTRLGCSILNQLWRSGTSVRFRRCTELLVQLVKDEEQHVWNQVVEPSVLVLDDVGANQGTDYARRTLQSVFDARLDAGKRTIWTSNLDLDELAEFLGDERLTSRIVGHCRIVKVAGDDWRLKPKRRAAASK